MRPLGQSKLASSGKPRSRCRTQRCLGGKRSQMRCGRGLVFESFSTRGDGKAHKNNLAAAAAKLFAGAVVRDNVFTASPMRPKTPASGYSLAGRGRGAVPSFLTRVCNLRDSRTLRHARATPRSRSGSRSVRGGTSALARFGSPHQYDRAAGEPPSLFSLFEKRPCVSSASQL